MSTCSFYYDESEHSRKINYKTISASNFYDNFIAMIVGWSDEKNDILQRHAAFEAKYEDRKDKHGEIKSTMLGQKQFKYGFASLNKQSTQFIDDFLSIFDEETYVYFSVSSKTEYLVLQIFKNYKNSIWFDADAMKYSLTKILVVYRPKEIIRTLCESPEDLVEELKKFLRDRIECNRGFTQLKEQETEAFQQLLFILDDVTEISNMDWNYHISFGGLKKYLLEKKITDYRLIIDKEGKGGEKSKTLQAAYEIGLDNSDEADSIEIPGLRIADMMAGIISKLMKEISESLRYQSLDEGTNKKILDHRWFCLNEKQFGLYKKLYRIICEWQPAWYKAYSGIYADDLVCFVTLLNFMNSFSSAKEIKQNITMRGEYFNTCACTQVQRSFERLKCKLPIEPVALSNEEYFLNERDGKVYLDKNRQPSLPLHEGSQIFEVLSVGIYQSGIPTVTVRMGEKTVCFRLPEELNEWACSVVGLTVSGTNLFPAKVIFSQVNGKCHADIL